MPRLRALRRDIGARRGRSMVFRFTEQTTATFVGKRRKKIGMHN